MRVLMIRPGEYTVVYGFLNTTEEIRDYLCGCMETVRYLHDYVIVCNDSFLCDDSKYNCTLGGIQFFGNIFICKIGFVNGEYDLVGLDLNDIPILLSALPFNFTNYSRSL